MRNGTQHVHRTAHLAIAAQCMYGEPSESFIRGLAELPSGQQVWDVINDFLPRAKEAITFAR